MLPSTSEYARFEVAVRKNEFPVWNSLRLRASFQASTASRSREPLKLVHWMLIPLPVFGSKEMSGPLLRRGTTRVAAGIAPAAGTVTRTPALLTLNVSGIGMIGSFLPLNTVLKPLGDLESGTIFS